ncbi:MAG: hypothetical protein EAZ97_09145 [Bacteroidetes bacterium]|nr:MAG: hypothetical protein EAZ97_09145 [Bacteroidota bacterium]
MFLKNKKLSGAGKFYYPLRVIAYLMAASMVALAHWQLDTWDNFTTFYVILPLIQPQLSLFVYWYFNSERKIENASLFVDCFWSGGFIVMLYFTSPASLTLPIMSLMNIMGSRGVKKFFYGFLSFLAGLGLMIVYRNVEIILDISNEMVALSSFYLFSYCILFALVVHLADRKLLAAKAKIASQNISITEQSLKLMELNEEMNQQREEIIAQRDNLEDKNAEIEQRQKQVIDSINYALRIQIAMLPSQAVFKKHLPESFIFYQPRDIVSGDFYWLEPKYKHTELETLPKFESIFLAVADCTGHGVSGAMMAMLGSNILSQIVNESEITEVNEILNELDLRIRKQLRQENRSSLLHDGMDIALILIEQNQIHFASAQRPLILLRNQEIIEFKGDKFPIGSGYYENKNFTKHVIPIEKEDLLFMFSDGITDQFDSKDHKKFGSRKLKELLQTFHLYSLKEQEELIKENFLAWKGQNKQTDDVLLIGIKF